MTIEATLTKISENYPHLECICTKAKTGNRQAINAVKTNVGMLAAPKGVSPLALMELFDA